MVPRSPGAVGPAPRSTAGPVAMIRVAVRRLPEVTDAVVMPMVAARTARADNVAPVRHDCGSAPMAHLLGMCRTVDKDRLLDVETRWFGHQVRNGTLQRKAFGEQ
jgi:hypothetical protein